MTIFGTICTWYLQSGIKRKSFDLRTKLSSAVPKTVAVASEKGQERQDAVRTKTDNMSEEDKS